MSKTFPNFLLIGAPKSGTTSLYCYLDEHPEIFMSPVKEPDFFIFNDQESTYTSPVDQNKKNNQIFHLSDYKTLFQNIKNEKMAGEASTTYLAHPEAAKNIKNFNPEMKLIAILRHPVEAAFSAYLMMKRINCEPSNSLEEAISDEDNRIKQNWFLGVYGNPQKYYQSLKKYYTFFPASQIKVFLYEDLKNNPKQLLIDIYDFLGVNSSEEFLPKTFTHFNKGGTSKSINKYLHKFLSQKSLIRSIAQTVIPKNERRMLREYILRLLIKKEEEKLSPESYNKLLEIYKEDITNLGKLINRDLSSWLIYRETPSKIPVAK